MDNLLVINTGGTFNKLYHPISGELIVDPQGQVLKILHRKWLSGQPELLNIIGKDSLEMTSQDRIELLLMINQSDKKKILIVHGTDTMHTTAAYLAQSEISQKQIVLTGAMVPYSIDPVEATANYASALGFLRTQENAGVYICMNGLVESHQDIVKDRKAGRFVKKI